jgi:hypothetical protein
MSDFTPVPAVPAAPAAGAATGSGRHAGAERCIGRPLRVASVAPQPPI